MAICRVVEYHVDGFRFDLASVLCRGTDGTPLDAPPLVRVSCYVPVCFCEDLSHDMYSIGCLTH